MPLQERNLQLTIVKRSAPSAFHYGSKSRRSGSPLVTRARGHFVLATINATSKQPPGREQAKPRRYSWHSRNLHMIHQLHRVVIIRPRVPYRTVSNVHFGFRIAGRCRGLREHANPTRLCPRGREKRREVEARGRVSRRQKEKGTSLRLPCSATILGSSQAAIGDSSTTRRKTACCTFFALPVLLPGVLRCLQGNPNS